MAGIGFFAPLPLALMMPFMAGQSMMMGDAFGKAFQYGKRKISSMTNEQFNAMTPDDLAREINTDYSAIIATMPQAMAESRAFQKLILIEMGEIIKDIPDVLKEFFFGTQAGQFEETGEGLPVNPSPNFDWTGTIFNFLSATGFATASANYESLKTALTALFSPITKFTDTALQAGQKLVDDFLSNLTPPEEEETFVPPEEEVVDINPPADDPLAPSELLTQEFINTLTQGDLQTGGHRTRIYKGKSMTWTGTHLFTWQSSSSHFRQFKWVGGVTRWQLQTEGSWSETQFLAKVNQLKSEWNSQYVVTIGGNARYYLLNRGHKPLP